MEMYTHLKKYLLIVVLGLLSSFSIAQDSIRVKGVVLSKQGEPLSGVAISIEGVIVNPQITDSTGTFEMMAPDGNVWLLITPIGNYHKKRVFLGGTEFQTIYLQNKDLPSDYGTVSSVSGNQIKRNILGAYDEVSTEAINTKPYQTIDQYFEGEVAGMRVINHSGMPGDGTFSFLRGISSMNTNNQPLYVVDGIPYENAGLFNSQVDGHNYSPLTSLEPQDITNITVLKDASATAIYGTQASNGVVIIETLKPTESKTTIDMNVRSGMNISPREIPVLSASQFRTYAQEVLLSSGEYEEDYVEMYPGLFDNRYSDTYHSYKHNTNWQNEVFRNSMINDGYLSVRGGDAIAKYGLSIGYADHQGIIKNSNYSRTNIRFVGSFNISEWLRMYVATNFNYNTSNLIETGQTEQTSAVLTSLYKSPTMHPYKFDKTGQQLVFLDEVGEFNVSNPLAVLMGFEGKNENYRLSSNVRFEGDLTKHLKWTSILGYNLNRMRENVFQPNIGVTTYLDGEAWNVIKHQTDNLKSLYNDNKLLFEVKKNEIHNIALSGGFRFRTNSFEEDYGISRNSQTNDQYKALKSGDDLLKETGGDAGDWNWLSVYADASYLFKDKYLLSASMALDGSSRVGKDALTDVTVGGQPMGIFYSVGAGWRLSEESVLKDLDWLEELKVRTTYGVTGNDDIGYTNSYSFYTPVLYRGTSGAILGTIPSTTLKNETKTMFNLGVDLSILGERLKLKADYFDNLTDDMLIFERQPSYMGYQVRPTNGGSLRNTGYEIAAEYRVIKKRNFKWDIGGNIAQFKNEVEQILGGELLTSFEGGEMITRIGEPVNSFYGYIAEGVYSSNTEANAVGLINDVGLAYAGGDVKYKDISGPNAIPDGVINKYDKTILGNPNPDFFGGVYTNIKYKNWGLNVLFTYSVGSEVYNYLRYQTEKMTDLSNQSAAVLNRWQREGQQTDIPRVLYDDNIGNTNFSSRWIEDGSYLRLKNLTLSYTIPNKFKTFGAEIFQSAKLYATATNLFTLTKYLGYDPEFSASVNPMMQGIDYGFVPQASSFMIGIKLGL